MQRTTIYLPDELKARLESAAREERRTEADIIREALDAALQRRRRPRPRIPLLPGTGLGRPDAAERSDELLDGFGA
ncbi:CopG family transcriptional regulator [Pseudonocardia sp.]|uniref:ribbon-helix-helix domain-containing protein n=1 Tax=Pseudonocardia sp. TaxID=60912 RepID=UPI00262005BB|nr:CopG family transcriptional regulator [Pseudonocardia sp.]